MQKTPKLQLNKPDLNDYVIVSDLNENMDILDEAVSELQDGSAIIPDLETTNKTLAGGINENKNSITSHLADDAAHGIGDEPLITTAQTLRGAINESFQIGNKVKSDTVDALLSVDDSLPVTSEDSWVDVIGAIGQISTGKKWASGTTSSTDTSAHFQYAGTATTRNSPSVTVSGLSFKPSLVYLLTTTASHSVYTEFNDGFYAKTVKVMSSFNGTTNNVNVYNYKADVAPAYVTETGFNLPVHHTSAIYTWIAFE